jgi:predicted  nucleic acid-binding Zn-ribbon protein
MPNINDPDPIDVNKFESKEFKEAVLNLLSVLKTRQSQLLDTTQRLKAATNTNVRKDLEAKINWLEREIKQIRSMIDVVK